MHTLLAIDTSTEACSVALLFNHEVTFDFILAKHDHTEHILPMIDRIIQQSDCPLSAIDAIAFGQGPGSFTGIRIGVGVALGLALGLDKPLIGVSTLMALAQGAYRKNTATHVISLIDARMGEVYLGQYMYKDQFWQSAIPELVIAPSEISRNISLTEHPYYSAGTGWKTYPNIAENMVESDSLLPHAQDLLAIAEQKWLKGDVQDVNSVEPTYLRNTITWKKLPGRT